MRTPLQIVAARIALTVGSLAGLGWLAPLEHGTGVWLGLHPWHAVVVPALIDSYVVLSVLTARDRRWSLPIAGISGLVGQLHAADVLPGTDDTVRGWVAALAAVIAVCVTARLKPLVAEVVAAVRAEENTARAAREAHEQAARDAAWTEAQRAHERALAREQAAHEMRLAEQAHAARIATEPAAEPPAVRAPRAPSVRRTARARAATARTPEPAGDVQRRKAVRSDFEAAEARTPWDNATLAQRLYGTDAPTPGQLRAASARASEWRRALAQEQRTATVP